MPRPKVSFGFGKEIYVRGRKGQGRNQLIQLQRNIPNQEEGTTVLDILHSSNKAVDNNTPLV